MFTSYFSKDQLLWLVLIVLIHLASIFYFSYKGKLRHSLLLLFAGGLMMRLVVINFDSYLHPWDEQYHAVIANNMAKENSLVPTLYYDTPLPYDPQSWTSNHVWLHKQPLYLWQMAVSIKLFGNSAFAVRLPSAIMMSLLILIIFRLGQLTISKQAGYISALLYATNNYLLDFSSGIYCTDHNDTAFIFYVALSIWAFTEYKIGNRQKFIWLIGLFAGCAILNKWLVGLLVFSGWAISVPWIREAQLRRKEIIHILKAFFICMLVVIPWQLYILTAFPSESHYEFSYASRHFFEVVEGHEGGYDYYFEQAVIQYGKVAILIIPALALLYFAIRESIIRISYITYVVAVYLFFTMAKTKMVAFCLVVSPLIFLALGNLISMLFDNFRKLPGKEGLVKGLQLSILVIIALVNLDLEMLQYNHTEWVPDDGKAQIRHSKIRITNLALSLAGKYDPKRTVAFNFEEINNIPFMFFSGYTAYNWVPSKSETDYLKKNGFQLLFIDNYRDIPDEIRQDNTIIKIGNSMREERICLKASNGKYICDDLGAERKLLANRDVSGPWETFTLIIFENDQCAIRSHTGNYFCSELSNKDQITGNGSKMGSWETFAIEYHKEGLISFKACNGKYISFDEASGQLYARSDTVGEKEKFKLIKN